MFSRFIDLLLGRVDLAKKAAENPERLDYSKSVVDLLKVLNMPSDFNSRARLARQFGMVETYKGTEAQNIWLHDQLKSRYAARG